MIGSFPCSTARRIIAAAGFAALSACTSAPPPPIPSEFDPITAPFASAALDGAQWGMVVATRSGDILIDVNGDHRFLPASNQKIVTSAAALANLVALDRAAPGTRIDLEPQPDSDLANIALVGGGDPSLSDEPDCTAQCLADLADQVAATGLVAVNKVIGDESWFPTAPHVEGWSWDDLLWSYGAPVSALSLNQNVVALDIAPGPAEGMPAIAAWAPGDNGMVIDNQLTTSSAADAAYAVSRPLGSDTVLLTGAVPQSAAPRRIRLAMDDPARHAAERLRRHLKARGIAVLGEVRVRRTPRPATTATLPAQPIAILPAAPLYEAIETVSKGSSNLQAELLLRHLGRLPAPTASTIAAPNPGASTIAGPGIDIPTGTTLDGLARLEHLLTSAGIYPEDYDLADGSGMSIYNRLSPASIVRLLVWIDRQPWGDDWTAAQAIGGVDGTLARRFTGTPLEGKVFAKSGTLFGTNTLSGFVQTARGNQLAFSIMVNDRDRESRTATPAIDAALLAIAERY